MKQHSPYEFANASFLPFKLGDKFLPRVLMWACALLIVIYGLAALCAIPSFKGFLEVMPVLEADPESPEAMFAFMTAYFRFLGIMMVFGLAAAAVMASAEAAMHRKYQRGEDPGGFPLRFGMDELFVFLLQIIVGLIAGGVFFVGYIVVAILMVITALTAQAAPIIAVVFGILTFIAFIAMIIAMIYTAVRLSPAAAMTVRDKEFRLFEAWKVTKGRIWPMIGSYVVVYLIGMLAANIIMGILMMIMFLGSGFISNIEQLESVEDPTAVFQMLGEMFLSPGMIISYIIFGFIYLLVMLTMRLCMAGIPSYTLKWWERDGGEGGGGNAPYSRAESQVFE